jgi:hypothetical protein
MVTGAWTRCRRRSAAGWGDYGWTLSRLSRVRLAGRQCYSYSLTMFNTLSRVFFRPLRL